MSLRLTISLIIASIILLASLHHFHSKNLENSLLKKSLSKDISMDLQGIFLLLEDANFSRQKLGRATSLIDRSHANTAFLKASNLVKTVDAQQALLEITPIIQEMREIIYQLDQEHRKQQQHSRTLIYLENELEVLEDSIFFVQIHQQSGNTELEDMKAVFLLHKNLIEAMAAQKYYEAALEKNPQSLSSARATLQQTLTALRNSARGIRQAYSSHHENTDRRAVDQRLRGKMVQIHQKIARILDENVEFFNALSNQNKISDLRKKFLQYSTLEHQLDLIKNDNSKSLWLSKQLQLLILGSLILLSAWSGILYQRQSLPKSVSPSPSMDDSLRKKMLMAQIQQAQPQPAPPEDHTRILTNGHLELTNILDR